MDLKAALARVASAQPEAVAVTDLTVTPAVKHSFAALEKSVNTLRGFLEAKVGERERIAILLPGTFECVRTIMASLLAERCYIPLQAGMARGRLEGILKDTEPAIVIVTAGEAAELTPWLAGFGYAPLACPEAPTSAYFHKAGTAPTPSTAGVVSGLGTGAVPETPQQRQGALILHTSGSTGAPKGILHSRAAVESCIQWYIEYFGSKRGDKLLSTIPLYFDPAVSDVFATILGGAELVLPGSDILENPKAFCETIAREEITVITSVPTFLRFLLSYGEPGRFTYPKLKAFYCGGEILTVPAAEQITKFFSSTKLYNFCGPAEIICACFYLIPPGYFEQERATIPIAGRSYGVGAYAIAEDGEMLVSGEQLMIGYWKRPDLTAEKIIVKDGVRWYRTGDVVEAGEGGTLLYGGRRDRMVNRRAVRIELDDVEKNVARVPGVSAAAVVAKPDPMQGYRIIAHVILSEPDMNQGALKARAREILPAEMMPDRFEVHATFPLTGMGKVDYQTLLRHGR